MINIHILYQMVKHIDNVVQDMNVNVVIFGKEYLIKYKGDKALMI